MKTIAWAILVAALACGSGCARPDWIEQTLVTVDVTGRWIGDASGGSAMGGASYVFVLEQQGPKVKGSMRRSAQTIPGRQDLRDLSGPIEGTVAGDVFSFRQTNGPLTRETTVSGDEMTGEVVFSATYRIILRRVDSRSRPNPISN
jgi:hypothetical protein